MQRKQPRSTTTSSKKKPIVKPQKRRTVYAPPDPELLRVLHMTDILCSDLGINVQIKEPTIIYSCIPLVQALQGLAQFMVFFLSHSNTNHADKVAEMLGIDRQEFDVILLKTIRNRLLSLRVDTFYENITTQEAANPDSFRPE